MTQESAAPKSGFDAFELDPIVRRGIADAGFSNPRPIQASTLPAALAGRDVLGLAQTGTGKTAAFALPILQKLVTRTSNGHPNSTNSVDRKRKARSPRALIVAPTRELVQQIDLELRTLGKHLKLRTVTLYGGVSTKHQIDALNRGVDVIVACPGRLLDLKNQRCVRLDRIETLVLDEADHMFDMGFLPDVKRILTAVPKERQTLLFSATMPKEIRYLADAFLTEPLVVERDAQAPADTIEHALYPIVEKRKLDLLHKLLTDEDFTSAIVFTRTKHRAKRLAIKLSRLKHQAIALQGNMSQNQRDRAMDGFRKRQFKVLVATDIAARGIDVAGVSHVINYDVPNTPDAYVHRIGRTGRAERSGRGYTFITNEDRSIVRAIERRIGSAVSRVQISELPDTTADAEKQTPKSTGHRPDQKDGPSRPARRRRTRTRKRPSANDRSRSGDEPGARTRSTGTRSKPNRSRNGRGKETPSQNQSPARRRRRRRSNSRSSAATSGVSSRTA